jgi:hypothetical protein
MPRQQLRTLARVAAVLAHLFCLGGGVWILTSVGFDHGDDDAIWTGMGLYFVGKSFFVGPMLWIAAECLPAKPDDK